MSAPASRSPGLQVLDDPAGLPAAATEWNRLARLGGSPYLSAEWLSAWWAAFGRGTFSCLLLRDLHGALLAGVCCQRLARGHLRATANVHSGDWDAVAADGEARAAIWRELARIGAGHLHLTPLRAGPASAGVAREVLSNAGYGLVEVEEERSPYLDLPGTWEELLRSVSRNLRSQLGRRRRALEREGRLTFRTTLGGDRLQRDFDTFLRLEGSGWKARAGTAILSDQRIAGLYHSFAAAAAAAGWLRLHLLELEGVPIAGDLSCAFAGGSFLIKTGFDERYAHLSPGLVLRGEALRASIEEGAAFYDFLGGPDPYKVRWANGARPRVTLDAYRGLRVPWLLYRTRIRPAVKAARDRVRSPARPSADPGAQDGA
jgi:CelD/BcsL family acetyltransferase involved in cellulose biosynthesis